MGMEMDMRMGMEMGMEMGMGVLGGIGSVRRRGGVC